MGVCITATNSQYEFNMGYGGFALLRKNIALTLDKDFGKLYSEMPYDNTLRHYKILHQADWVIEEKQLDIKHPDIIDFLYMSDCGGKITYKACKQIYDLIKDVDFKDKHFCYANQSKGDYERFKLFLKECYTKRRYMRWD